MSSKQAHSAPYTVRMWPMALLVVGAGVILAAVFDRAVVYKHIQHTNLQPPGTGPLDAPTYSREVLRFPCSGVSCEAWLYMPKQQQQAARPPVVVMAHGMGGQKDMGLHKFASSFVEAGMAAFVFDYRCFGGSEGEPRNWVAPRRHVADWLDAVKYVREQLADRVDASHVGLWGTSFAGGHVLVVASQTPNISAVVSQVPHLDASTAARLSLKRRGVLQSLRGLAISGLEQVRMALGMAPGYLPLVGKPGSVAFMQLDEYETAEYFSKHPKVYQGGWENLARATLTWDIAVHRYSPIKYVPEVTAPVLFIAATNDTLCAFESVEKAVQIAPNAQLMARDCTHFELYRNHFDGVIHDQISFLRQHLGLGPLHVAPAAVQDVDAITR